MGKGGESDNNGKKGSDSKPKEGLTSSAVGKTVEGDSEKKSNGSESKALLVAKDVLPDELTIIPMEHRPLFPGMMVPLMVNGEALIQAIGEIVKKETKAVGVVLFKSIDEDSSQKFDFFSHGTVARIHRLAPVNESTIQVLVEGVRRFRQVKVLQEGEIQMWRVQYFQDPETQNDEELRAYIMAIISAVKDLLKLNPMFQEQLRLLMSQISHKNPGKVMDLIASMTTAAGDRLQELLETLPLLRRAQKLLLLLKEEIELSKIQEKISKQIEEKISKQQKEFFLHEQLKAIKKELGLEKDDKTSEVDKLAKRLKKLKLSAEAQKVIDEEMDKFKLLESHSAEFHVTRNYLDWLTILPWGLFSKDNYDLKRARAILNRDHFGLDDVKQRILEFISIGRKRGKITGSILCFVGPPGVGKTSIGRSVASALKRKFFRFSLGGMRDEAEIKGHRRTYIGAMPGKFIQALKSVGTANPVLMLDEVDKIGHHFQGDPASALLEVLDPEQNRDFLDHYLDVRFDLSNVLFIATANTLDTIPPALLDRMEVIKLSGYLLEEKVQIARKFLIPRQLKEHGLDKNDCTLSEESLKYIIDRYAREAGVRALENMIKKLFRRITLRHSEGNEKRVTMSRKVVEEFLGKPIFTQETLYKKDIPGVVLGLAWTAMGGATLYVEATAFPSKTKGFRMTGQLGDVMKESAEIAYSYIQSASGKLKVSLEFFESHLIHLHVPSGATPKDGPSAGITMALALFSLATRRPVRRDIAMTGELTITGKVLPIGGIKEKSIAAKRVGILELIFPEENRKDFEEIPDYIRKGLKVHFVNYFGELVPIVFGK